MPFVEDEAGDTVVREAGEWIPARYEPEAREYLLYLALDDVSIGIMDGNSRAWDDIMIEVSYPGKTTTLPGQEIVAALPAVPRTLLRVFLQYTRDMLAKALGGNGDAPDTD